MPIPSGELNFEAAVGYHYDRFPPASLDYGALIGPATRAADALARFDQMLKTMHNSAFLLAPLRQQEAVISSRMEGTVSTMDEILMYEAEYDEAESNPSMVRSEIIETALYARALTTAQKELESGHKISEWLIVPCTPGSCRSGVAPANPQGSIKVSKIMWWTAPSVMCCSSRSALKNSTMACRISSDLLMMKSTRS